MSPYSTSLKLRSFFLAAALSSLSTVSAVVVPTAPGPGAVFNQGSKCSTSWTGDTEGKWSDMTIELMTGNNFQMIHLSTVGSGLDGNQDGTLDFTCPEVSPYSAIYFFQYSSPSSPGVFQWVTRFTIADSNGNSVPPPETTQPDGVVIPWGVGSLGSGGGGGGGGNSGSPSSNGGSTIIPTASTSTSTPPSASLPLTFITTSNSVIGGATGTAVTHSTTTSTLAQVSGIPATNGVGTGVTTVRTINTQVTTGSSSAATSLGVSGTGSVGANGSGNAGANDSQNTNHGSSFRFDSFEFAGVKASVPVSFVTLCLFSVIGVFLY